MACPHCFNPNYLSELANSQQIPPVTSTFYHCSNCQTNFAVGVGLGAGSSPLTTGGRSTQKQLIVTTAGPVSFLGYLLIGINNLNTVAQTVTGKIYDNPTSAAGTIVEDIGPLGASQILTFPGLGLLATSGGFTISLSGIPTGDGIEILYK